MTKMVRIHKGNSSAGGIFIYEEVIEGTVVKVNEKSIRVHMGHVKHLINGETVREYDINEEARFTFLKTIENRQVDLYKNSKYGTIEIAH